MTLTSHPPSLPLQICPYHLMRQNTLQADLVFYYTHIYYLAIVYLARRLIVGGGRSFQLESKTKQTQTGFTNDNDDGPLLTMVSSHPSCFF